MVKEKAMPNNDAGSKKDRETRRSLLNGEIMSQKSCNSWCVGRKQRWLDAFSFFIFCTCSTITWTRPTDRKCKECILI